MLSYDQWWHLHAPRRIIDDELSFLSEIITDNCSLCRNDAIRLDSRHQSFFFHSSPWFQVTILPFMTLSFVRLGGLKCGCSSASHACSVRQEYTSYLEVNDITALACELLSYQCFRRNWRQRWAEFCCLNDEVHQRQPLQNVSCALFCWSSFWCYRIWQIQISERNTMLAGWPRFSLQQCGRRPRLPSKIENFSCLNLTCALCSCVLPCLHLNSFASSSALTVKPYHAPSSVTIHSSCLGWNCNGISATMFWTCISMVILLVITICSSVF